MTPRVQRLAVLVLAAGAVGVGAAAAIWSAGFLQGTRGGQAVPERPRVSGEFELVDVAGRAVRWSGLGDRLQLVFFGFTNCPEVCPVTVATAVEAIRSLGPAGSELRLVLVSVDPERDTPQAMAAYLAPFGPQVLGLTGTPAQVAAAAAAFGVFYEKAPMSMPGEYMVNHTSSLFVMGPGDEILDILPYGAKAAEVSAALRRHL